VSTASGSSQVKTLCEHGVRQLTGEDSVSTVSGSSQVKTLCEHGVRQLTDEDSL